MVKRILALVLSFVACISCISCGDNNPADSSMEQTGNYSGKVNVWTAYSTEKIMQQQDYNDRYDNKTLKISAFRNEYEAGQIIISANKEDKTDIKAYELTVNDLRTSEGDILSKDEWTVYNQKYIYVSKINNTLSGNKMGWYPDALLPMETAIEYGENSISWEKVATDNINKRYEKEAETNLNQGIWLEVNPPKDAKAGIYSGNFDLNVDGKKYTVPVQVEVFDYTLGDYTHTKSTFGLKAYDIGLSELDTSKEMLETYKEYLLDHRIMPEALTIDDDMQMDNLDTPEVMEAFLDEAVQVALDGRYTTFNLPFKVEPNVRMYWVQNEDGFYTNIFRIKSGYEKEDWEIIKSGCDPVTPEQIKEAVDNGNYRENNTVDFEVYQQTLINCAERSLQECFKLLDNEEIVEPVDIIKKASTYFIMYDEYDANGTHIEASYGQERGWQTNQAAAAEIESKFDGWLAEIATQSGKSVEEVKQAFDDKYGMTYEDYKARVVKECKNIKNKVVGSLSENMIAEHSVFVPQIRFINTEEDDKSYYDYQVNAYGEENVELWTYICNHPWTPFTTLQTDDFLISSRLYGWFMYRSNIVGHLSWAAVYNQICLSNNNGGTKDYHMLMDDFYDAGRWYDANGEGNIVYAGREYGIYGPIPSMRIKSLRDGIEDYDLFYELEEVYKSRGVSGDSFDSVFNFLHEKVINRMKVNYDNENLLNDFDSSRQLLGDMLSCAYSSNGLIFEEYKISKNQGILTLSAKEGVTVTCNGKSVVGESFVDDNGERCVRYKFMLSLDGEENIADIVALKDGVESKLAVNLGGKLVSIEGNSLKDKLTMDKNNTLSTQESLTNDRIIDHEVEGEIVAEKVTTITFAGAKKGKEYQTAILDTSSYQFKQTTKSIKLYIYYDGTDEVEMKLYYKTQNRAPIDIINTYTLKNGWNEIVISGATLSFSDASDSIARLDFNVYTTESCVISLGNISVGG